MKEMPHTGTHSTRSPAKNERKREREQGSIQITPTDSQTQAHKHWRRKVKRGIRVAERREERPPSSKDRERERDGTSKDSIEVLI